MGENGKMLISYAYQAFYAEQTSLNPRINLINTMGTAPAISIVKKWFVVIAQVWVTPTVLYTDQGYYTRNNEIFHNVMLPDRRKCTVSGKPIAYYMAQWCQYWIIILVSESYLLDGCRACSQLTINDLWQFRKRGVWRYWTAIRIYIFTPFRNRGRHMALPQYTGALSAVGIVGFCCKLIPEKAKVGMSVNQIMLTVFRIHEV